MIFLQAFIVGGLLCLMCQLVLMYTPLDPLKILAICFALGGILSPLGIPAFLESWGGAGFGVMVFGAGAAVAGAAEALALGNPIPAIMIIGLFVVLVLMGVLAGLLHASLAKKPKQIPATAK